MILPAGSPLVQFELTGFPYPHEDGSSEVPLPLIIWVNRVPGERLHRCGKLAFAVSVNPGLEIVPKGGVDYAAVCFCMGRFIE